MQKEIAEAIALFLLRVPLRVRDPVKVAKAGDGNYERSR
jgi:hypothetical protein